MRTERVFGFLKPQVALSEWDGEVRTLPLPDRVRVPLSRPGRVPLRPVVTVGEKVKSGQPLASTLSGTAVHAPITGEVIRIGPLHTPDGLQIQGIDILRGETEDWMSFQPIEDAEGASVDDLMNTAHSLGFPAPWKPEVLGEGGLSSGPLPIRTIAVIAVDREPGLSVQRRYLTERREELIGALGPLQRMAGDIRLVLLVPRSLANEARGTFSGIDVQEVPERYPENHWRLVLARLAGKGNLTIPGARGQGILLLTAENVALAGRALREGRPRTTKLITVSGKGMAEPVTVEAVIGTPISHVFEELGIQVEENDRIILGGIWRGHAQFDLQAPITRATDGLTIIPASEVVHLEEAPCIHCGRCVRACPVRIQVGIVARLGEFGFGEDCYQAGAHACIECGLCAYVCPAKRPLVQYMRFGKSCHEKKEAEEAAAAVE